KSYVAAHCLPTIALVRRFAKPLLQLPVAQVLSVPTIGANAPKGDRDLPKSPQLIKLLEPFITCSSTTYSTKTLVCRVLSKSNENATSLPCRRRPPNWVSRSLPLTLAFWRLESGHSLT